MKAEFKDEAEEEARASVLLRAIADREGVEVTDGDMQKRIAELAAARQDQRQEAASASWSRTSSMPALQSPDPRGEDA